MRAVPSLLAFATFCFLLLGWRALYSSQSPTYAGLACLTALGALGAVGGYRVALGRRRALLAASIEEHSSLKRLLSGRIGASMRAVAGLAASLPITGYFWLTAQGTELFLAAAAAAWAMAMVLLLERSTLGHLKPAFRLSCVAPAALWLTAIPVICVTAWFSYSVLPIPEFAQAGRLEDAIGLAIGDLPRHHPMIFETFSALRAADAATYWLLARDGFETTLILGAFLLKSAVSYVSITKIAVDCQIALLRRGEA